MNHLIVLGLLSCLPALAGPTIEGRVGEITVLAYDGDLLSANVDAQVVPQFREGMNPGGIALKVLNGNGKNAMEAYRQAAKSGLQYGQAVIAPADGEGPAPYFISVASVGSGADKEFRVISDSVYNALKAAQARGLKSIAFPALGTGIAGDMNSRQSADAMLSGLQRFVQEGGKMDRVVLVAFRSEEVVNAFRNSLERGTYEVADLNQVGRKERTFEQMEAAWAEERAGLIEAGLNPNRVPVVVHCDWKAVK